MRVAIYSKPDRPGGESLRALARGAENRGHSVFWRNPGPFTAGQEEPFDVVIVWNGHTRKHGEVSSAYKARGVPVVAVEWGYFERGCGNFALGDGGHYWIPIHTPGLRLLSGFGDPQPRGDVVLVCGQDPRTDKRIGEMVEELIRPNTARKIAFRPHPSVAVSAPWADEEVSGTTLEFDLSRAWCVVTWTSNVGNEAIVRGIPVLCGPGAMYSSVAECDWKRVESVTPPPAKDVSGYISRLAWAQWTLDELATGLPLEFVLQCHRGVGIQREMFSCLCTTGHIESFNADIEQGQKTSAPSATKAKRKRGRPKK